MILAKNFIKTGFTEEDALPIYNAVEKELSDTGKAVIDFSEIRFFTTLFFNNALGKFFMKMGEKSYTDSISVTGLSDVGKVTYNHYLGNARRFFELNANNKTKEYDEIVMNQEN